MAGINANTDTPNMHKSDTYGVPRKYWNGVLPSGRTANLESTIQRTELQMEWQVKFLKLYASVRLDLSLVASCESLNVSVHCFNKTIALMTCFWRESLNCSCVSFACNCSAHVNDTHLFVALKGDWIEETVSFKMSQDFLRQVLINTFPSAHEADHHSTARFHDEFCSGLFE